MNKKKSNTKKQTKYGKSKLIIGVSIGIGLAILLTCFFMIFKNNDVEPVSQSQETEETSSENSTNEVTTVSNSQVSNSAVETDSKLTKKAEKILSSMSLEEKVNQMFFITPEALTGVDCVVAAGEQTKSSLEAHPVGGIIYFGQNITGEKQTKEMIANIKKYVKDVCKVPLFIGIDEEGGTVARLGNSDTVNVKKVDNMSVIGKSGDIKNAYKAGDTIGKYLSDYGFNIDFAPDADVLTNSQNQVVKDRSFGSDPKLVSQMALEVSKGLNDNGIYSCFKHFPGHGATKDDTHEGFAYTDKTYEELSKSELVPFVDAINNNADFIMVGHISVPQVVGDKTPASISSVIIDDILKGRLGYKGIVITDSLSMGALTNLYQSDEIAVRAVNAGVDVLLMPQNFNQAYNGLLNAVKSGKISEKRIDESVLKIIEKKLKYL